MSEMRDTLEAALVEAAEQHGYELVDVEVAGSQGRPIVRVFLDRAAGIDLEAVTEANSWVTPTIDCEGLIEGAYVLEVSSPGIERPLRKREHFERFAGERASVKVKGPIDGRKNFIGRIVRVDGDTLVLDEEGVQRDIPLGDIAKARLKPEIALS